MAEKLTLASMCAGGVQERIDRALAKISDNILDLNTDAKKKRVLDVKITLTPLINPYMKFDGNNGICYKEWISQ